MILSYNHIQIIGAPSVFLLKDPVIVYLDMPASKDYGARASKMDVTEKRLCVRVG